MSPSPIVEKGPETTSRLRRERGSPAVTSVVAGVPSRRPATVTDAPDRLEAREPIAREPSRRSEHTGDDEPVAVGMARHHRLLEIRLAERLGRPRGIHGEADGSGHHVGGRFEPRLTGTPESPRRDPHADPDRDRTTPSSAREIADRAVVGRVSGRDGDDLAHPTDPGITPGTPAPPPARVVDVARLGVVGLGIGDTGQAVREAVTVRNGAGGRRVERRGGA